LINELDVLMIVVKRLPELGLEEIYKEANR